MTAGSGLQADLRVVRSEGFTLEASLMIPRGRTLALLGPNGAGKSTAVAAVAGLIPLTSGRIRLYDRLLDDPEAGVFVPPEDRRIGVVFQDYLLFPHLTVADNVGFGLRSRGSDRSETADRVDHWLRRLDLSGLAHRRPRDLSGGQAQRVALARALASEPDLLLLDEPLAALDVTTRSEMRHVLSDHLRAFPGPRLLITHDPMEAFLLADEIALLESGSVTQAGSAEDIRLRPRSRYAADLVGSNLLVGHADDGVVLVDGHVLHIADTGIHGTVLATIDPRAVSVHRHRPEGSPRNVWETVVGRVEPRGDRVRIQLAEPLPIVAEVTPGAARELELDRGRVVWVSIKATEIGLEAG